MPNRRTALILSGGGARAAYQVGVLRAILELLPDETVNPFPILCGTSAGAINTATLACYAENFRAAIDNLNSVWHNMHAGHIYRADPAGIGLSGLRWFGALALGWRHAGFSRARPCRRVMLTYVVDGCIAVNRSIACRLRWLSSWIRSMRSTSWRRTIWRGSFVCGPGFDRTWATRRPGS